VIDPLTEEIIWPRVAARMFPRGENGKYPHISKIYRLMKTGCRGVVLESIRTPRLATSREAVARFFCRLGEVNRAVDAEGRGPAGIGRASLAAEQELVDLGF
jgi:hypothetical protein